MPLSLAVSDQRVHGGSSFAAARDGVDLGDLDAIRLG